MRADFWNRRGTESNNIKYLKQLINDYFGGYLKVNESDKSKSILRLCEKIGSIGMVLYERSVIRFLSNATNPYCDKPTVVIPTIWTMPLFWEKVFNVPENESLLTTIAGVMGAISHESCHNIYTDNTNLKEMAEKYGTRKDDNYIKFLCTVINVEEDLYIDERARYEVRTKRISRFTDYMRNFTNRFDIDKINSIKVEYERKLHLLATLLSLEVMENLDIIDPHLDPDITNFALQILEIDDYDDRVIHSVKLCDMLLDGVTEQEMQENEDKKEKEGGFSISFGGEGSPKDFNELDAETQQKILDFIEQNKEAIEEATKQIEKAIAARMDELNKLSNKQYQKITPKVPRLAGEGKINDDKVALGNNEGSYQNWYVDPAWRTFAQHIRNAKSFQNKSPRLAKSGYDIDIDSIPHALQGETRIFIDNGMRKVKSEPQVILRCDGSGSTNYTRDKDNKTLRQRILEAACGMMMSLIKVNVPFFGFMDTTGGSYHSEQLLIYKLGCNLLPFNYDLGDYKNKNAHDIIRRCRDMNATSSNGNNDGFALEYGSMFATDNSRPKVMISLSDGAPSSSRDDNLSSEEYLIQSIASLRKQGWLVFSVSLIDEVVEANDLIYGSDFNVDASVNVNSALISLGKKLLKAS
jgi:ferritin